MTYKVKHEADLSEKELKKMPETMHGQTGAYFVLDRSGVSYGRYEDFEDAVEHAETLNEMEEL